MPNEILYEDDISGGCHWTLLMRKGTSLKLIDKEGGANVGILFYNPTNLLERYNAPDTLKCQHTFKLTKGNCLYSDMGRIFCSIVDDTVGWHETVCGNTTKAKVKQKWGEHNYQDHGNNWYQNGYDSFLIELAKMGLGKSDMASNINFFSKVEVSDSGELVYVAKNSQPSDYVELRFEMDTIVILHTSPHPLNNENEYPRKPIGYQICSTKPVRDDDYCMNFRPENQRGFENTNLFHLGVGSHD